MDAALWQAKAKSDRVVVDLRRLVFQDRTCLQTLLVADAFARRAGAVIHKVLIGPADADAP